MRLKCAALVLLAAGCATFKCPERGGPSWWRLQSRHFSVASNLPREQARDSVHELEQLHAALHAVAWHGAPISPARLDVVLLRDQKEVSIFAGEKILGYVVWDVDGERTLVAQDGEDAVYHAESKTGNRTVRVTITYRSRTVLIHEISHVLAAAFLLQQPRWLSEGLAQFLETMAVDKAAGTVTIGAPARDPLLFFTAFPKAVYASTLIRGKQISKYGETGFYANSWALVHYLLNRQGRRFNSYQQRLMRGNDPSEAWRAEFPELQGRVLDKEIRLYLRQLSRSKTYSTATAQLPHWDGEVRVEPLPEPELHALWARLYRLSPRGGDAVTGLARGEAEEALRLDPRSVAAAAEGVRWVPPAERETKARTAAQANPSDARGQVLLASTLEKGSAERIAALESAVALAPEWPLPLLRLSNERLAQGQQAEALSLALRAVAAGRGNHLALEALADALSAGGHCDQALAAQRRAVESAAHGLSLYASNRMRDTVDALERRCGTPVLEEVPVTVPEGPAASEELESE